MEKIDPELLKRLDLLATKIGVTAQYLWDVLMRQGIVEGWVYVGGGIFLLIAVVVALLGARFLCRSRTREKENRYSHDKNDSGTYQETYSWYDENESYAVAAWLLGCVAMGFFIWACQCIFWGLLDLANPAFFALHEILKAL